VIVAALRRFAKGATPPGAEVESVSVTEVATLAIGSVPVTVIPDAANVGSGTAAVVEEVTLPEELGVGGGGVGVGAPINAPFDPLQAATVTAAKKSRPNVALRDRPGETICTYSTLVTRART